MLDIALEVPLPALAFGRRRKRSDARGPWAEVFGDPLDGATLTGSIASFEDDHDAVAGGPNPLLELHQFGLQAEQLGFIDVVGNLVRFSFLSALFAALPSALLLSFALAMRRMVRRKWLLGGVDQFFEGPSQ